MTGRRFVVKILLCFTAEDINTKERKAARQWPQKRIRALSWEVAPLFLCPRVSALDVNFLQKEVVEPLWKLHPQMASLLALCFYGTPDLTVIELLPQ